MTETCPACGIVMGFHRYRVPILESMSVMYSVEIRTVDVCSAECAPAVQQVAFRALHPYDAPTIPQTYIRGWDGRNQPVDVPTAEPPEWYAAYFEECQQSRHLPDDERSLLKRSEDEWAAMKQWYATEDSWQDDREFATQFDRRRHKVWG